MKIISRKTHGGLDYGAAIVLIVSPWLFNFSDVEPAKSIAIGAGILIVMMSLFTNYETGFIKAIPMQMHLYADILVGLFLIASPWLFKFSNETYLFHVIMGLFSVIAGVITNNESYQHRYDQHHHSLAK